MINWLVESDLTNIVTIMISRDKGLLHIFPLLTVCCDVSTRTMGFLINKHFNTMQKLVIIKCSKTCKGIPLILKR